MRIKWFLITAAFIACLALLVIVRLAISGSYGIHRVDYYEGSSTWAGFELDNLLFDPDRNSLLIDRSSGAGVAISPEVKADFEFDEILLSWNSRHDESAELIWFFGVSPDGVGWSDFLYQRWGRQDIPGPDSISLEIPDVGRLDVDVMRLYKPMRYYRFCLACFADTNGIFQLERVSVCYSNTRANLRQYKTQQTKAAPIRALSLEVPYRTQHSLPDSLAGRTCSPTSLSMVLNYHNLPFEPEAVSQLVYDPHNGIFGNWPYNIEAAYLLGMRKAWVGRHSSFGELMAELASGRPVVISIALDDGKLGGAPYSETEGHLIVVRGFDDHGNVLVNDPAGHDTSDGVNVYNIDELTAAWVGHGGVAYHLWPE